MSGFFRRLRRPKEEVPEPEEEPSIAPDGADELPVEPEPTSPMTPDTEPARDPAPEPVLEPAPPTPVPAPDPFPAPAVPSAPAPPTGPVVPATPVGPPPPLPEADRVAARSSLSPRRTSTKCFLCGTEMDGPWCPTCRIAWND